MQKVVIGIVEDNDDGILVVERLKEDGIRTSFPGGEINPEETEEDAVCREILEETNQKVTAVEKLGERQSPYDPEIILCYWLCKQEMVTPLIPETGKIANAWYAERNSLVDLLGSNIYQPVKERLEII